MKKTILITILLSAALLLNGCVPVIVGGAAAGGKVLAEDKTVGEAVSDSTVWTKIRAGFISQNLDSLVGSVNVAVSEGRVLLTGRVKDSDTMLKVIRVCWDQDGVKEVINELKVEEQSDRNFSGYTKDSWITTRIKSKLLVTGKVKSVNYTVETIDGVVYLLGIARTQDELDTVTDIAATVSGVEKVISYVKVQGNLESRVDKTQGKGLEGVSVSNYNDKPLPVEESMPVRDNMQMSDTVPQHDLSTLPSVENRILPNPNPKSQVPVEQVDGWQKDEEFDDSF